MAYSNQTLVGCGAVVYATFTRFAGDNKLTAGDVVTILIEEERRYNETIGDYHEVVLGEDLLQFLEDAAHRTIPALYNCVGRTADNETCEMSIVDVLDTDYRISRLDVLRTLKQVVRDIGGNW